MEEEKSAKRTVEIKELLPKEYEFIKCLGRGGFGQLVKCQKQDTQEVVAIKLPIHKQNNQEEVHLLQRLMDEGMDQRHIVKFFGAFDTHFGKGMIFEMLDMDLLAYLNIHYPLPLLDIQAIIKQVATALDVLKNMSIIHSDLKLGNVMVCNHTQRPIHVKLIDFGLAIPTVKVKPGMQIQSVCYRPPEVILGLRFNEAVDVWNLGTMTARLMIKQRLFPNDTEYETLKAIVKLFGTPSKSYLKKGLRIQIRRYFKRSGQNWILRTHSEILELDGCQPKTYFTEKHHSLRDLIKTICNVSSLEEDRDIEAATLLLGRMLEIDPEKRITPSEILQHPFICDELESSSVLKVCVAQEDDRFNKPLTCEETRTILPEGLRVIKMLGNGSFGQLFKCRRVDSRAPVTVMLPYSNNRTQREVQLLERIAENELDQKNIVKFIETLPTRRGEALVLEKLNMKLASYIKQHYPLQMTDIRAIVKQTATALQTLESQGIIHTRVMVENIWLCHCRNKPIKIKLADFGAFIDRKRALLGKTAQGVHYRAPEIILGLPFDQAIDVWSLGCTLLIMLIGFNLFPNKTEFETLRTIIQMFGQPPDNVLNEAIHTHEFFKAVGKSWQLKTASEFEASSGLSPNTIKDHNTDAFESLDNIIESHILSSHYYENIELAACIDLMKAMLNMDGTQRITPAQILEHNCIHMSREREVAEPAPEEQVDTVQSPMKLPVIIMVKPASPENTTAFVEDHQVSKSMSREREVAEPAPEEQVDTVQSPMKLPVTIMVKPASPENTTAFVEDHQVSKSVVSLERAKTVDIDPVQEVIAVKSTSSGDAQVLEQDKVQSGSPKKHKKPRWRTKVAPMPTEQPTTGFTSPPKRKNSFKLFLSWFKHVNCFSYDMVE